MPQQRPTVDVWDQVNQILTPPPLPAPAAAPAADDVWTSVDRALTEQPGKVPLSARPDIRAEMVKRDLADGLGPPVGVSDDIPPAAAPTRPAPAATTIDVGPAATMARIGYQPRPINPTPRPAPSRLGSAKTGGMATEIPNSMPILDAPHAGAEQMAQGMRTLAAAATDTTPVTPSTEPFRRSRTGALYQPPPPIDPRTKTGAADILEGGMKLTEPVVAALAVANPFEVASALIKGGLSAAATQKTMIAAGASPESARLAADAAGAIGAGVPLRDTYNKAVLNLYDRTRAMADAAEARRNPSPAVIAPEPTDIPVTPTRPQLAADNLGAAGRAAERPPTAAVAPEVVWKAVDDAVAPASPQTPPSTPPTAADVWTAVDAVVAPSEPRSAQGPTTPSPAETPRPVAVRPGAGESVGPVASSPVPPPDASTVAPTAPAPDLVPVGDEATYAGPDRRGPARVSSPDEDQRYAEMRDKIARGEPTGTQAAREAFAERQRVEALRPDEPPREAPGDAPVEAPPETPAAAPAANPHVSTGYDPAALTTAERRELRRMHAEMDSLPYVGRQFNDAGVGKGGALEVTAGAGGAPVFHDIGGSTRAAVTTAIQRVLDGKKPSAAGKRAIDVARKRVRDTGEVTPPSLPLEAGESGVPPEAGPEDIRARANARVADPSDLDFLARRYDQRRDFGNVVSRDNAKELFYRNGEPAERTALNDAVSDAAGKVADAAYLRRLAEPKGHDATVVLTSGGTGSGKTTVGTTTERAQGADVVFDSQGTDIAAMNRRITQARQSGRTVEHAYVYRDPLEAWIDGVLPRADDTGRPVSIEGHVASHRDALRAALAVSKAHATDPGYHLTVYDNTGQAARELPRAEARRFLAEKAEAYNEGDVRQAIRATTDSAFEEGLIPEHLYDAYVAGATGGGGAAESGGGREPQSAAPEVPEAPAGSVPGRRTVPAAEHPQEVAPSSHEAIWKAVDEAVGPEKPREFSSTQIDLPAAHADAVKKMAATIPEADLADDGREDHPHVTVKFGLHTNDAAAVRRVLADEGPITVRLGKTSVFPAKDGAPYDVVKVDVDSPDLHRLNQKIADALPHTDTHPTYQPHVTLAYVKPGLGKTFAGRTDLEGRTMRVSAVTFSGKDRQVETIALQGAAPVTPKSETAAKSAIPITPREEPTQAEPAEHAFTAENLQKVFGLNEEQSAATMALVKAMGLDPDRLALAQGKGLSPETLQQIQSAPPIFYSALARAVEAKMPNRASAEQILKIASNPQSGVKAEELKWSGLETWLKDQQGPVTKQAVLDFLHANRIRVDEVTLGERRGPIEWHEIRGNSWSGRDDGRSTGYYISKFPAGYRLDSKGSGLTSMHDTFEDAVKQAETYRRNAREDMRPTKFSAHQLPGGENYRELLLTLPQRFGAPPADWRVVPRHEYPRAMEPGAEHWFGGPDGKFIAIDGNGDSLAAGPTADAAMREAMKTHTGVEKSEQFTAGHFEQPNVLVHLRINDRTSSDGKRVLFIEEVQSDWHQKGRKRGYSMPEPTESDIDLSFVKSNVPQGENPANYPGYWESRDRRSGELITRHPGRATRADAMREALGFGSGMQREKVPDAPFKTTWHELALKRALRYAADKGYDAIAWTTGEQQNERYDLSKQVSQISWTGDGTDRIVTITPKGGGNDIELRVNAEGRVGGIGGWDGVEGQFHGQSIADVVGKEIGDQIVAERSGDLSGDGLKVGGKGMRGFYDDILPRFLNKYTKPFGGKVGTTQISVGADLSPEPRYVGPALSESQVSRVARDFEREQGYGGETLEGIISIANRMQRGYTFTQAMEEAASAWSREDFANVAEALGGSTEGTTTPNTAGVHALDITPEMRRGVLAGQPLFQAKPKAPTSDLFDTGEEQPRLPGAEDVREQEIATPELARNDEFRLTAEVSKRKGKQDALFQAAYHGSPHKFEQFSLHHIGTGEGAQAYGWGLYFASKREIADDYRRKLSRVHTNIFTENSVIHTAIEITRDGRVTDTAKAAAHVRKWREAMASLPALRQKVRSYIDAPDFKKATYDKLAQPMWNAEEYLVEMPGLPTGLDDDQVRGLLPVLERAAERLDKGDVPSQGRTYKVDIPEDEDYLDWDLPASKQSPKVQAALRELGIEWEPVKAWSPGRFLHWTNSNGFDRLWREDVGIRATLQGGINIAESGDKAAFEHWYQKHQGMFPKGAVDPLGETIYNDLTWKARPPADGGIGSAPRQKAASEKLAALGLAGIKYDDGLSRGKGNGSHNYVVFDDKLVQIMEFDQGAKGAVEFTEGGRAIIRALESPDVSTAVHEIAHVARRFLFDRNLPSKERAGISDEDIATAETWAGVDDSGVWSREAEEKFARGFERYLHDGQAPTSKLRALFDKLRSWLRDIYRQLKGSAIDIDISDAMRKVFDKLLSRDQIPVTPKAERGEGPTLQSAVIPGAKEFVEQDVAPAVKEAAEKVETARQDIRAMFAPDTIGDVSRATADTLRAHLAARDLRIQRAQKALRAAEKALDRRSDADNLDLIYAIEEGKTDALPADLQPIARSLRDVLDQKREQVQARGKLDNYIENYFPHEWKQPSKAKQLLSRIMGRKPLQGPRSFLKQRTIPTTRDGVAFGLTPADPNPVRLVLHKVAEMDKWSMAYDVLHDWKALGVAQFVRPGDVAPEGWRRYHDSFGTVYGRSEGGDLIVRGHYYGPPEAVRILDNHLSPGLRGNAAFDLYRQVGNALNMVQLGLSGFHITMTGVEAMVSKLAQGIEEVTRGEFGYAGKSFAEFPVATFTTLWKGDKALRQLYAADPNMLQAITVADRVAQGGGGIARDKTMRAYEDRVETMLRAFRRGNYPGALGRAMLAAFELPTKFIMEWWVPRLKLGAYLDMVAMEMRTLGDRPSIPDARRVFGQAWDSIDNRFGQLVYDNLFWKNALKDAGMASVRALGWNVGTAREVFGAPSGQLRHLLTRPTRLRDTGRSADLLGETPLYERGNDPVLTHKAAYTIAMTFGVALIGAIYQYLHTDEAPREAKDYFFPRTGNTRPDGREERVSFPSYFKDVYAVGHAMPQSVLDTASHKLNPLLNMLADLWKNEDYFGTQIRNPDDPVVDQAKQVATYIGHDVVPISVRSYQQRKEDKGKNGVSSVESFFGVTPAPASVYRSKAEDLMRQYLPPSVKTQRQADAAEASREVRDALRTGGTQGREEAKTALQKGILTPRQVQNAERGARMTPMQAGFQHLTLEQALSVYRVATPSERGELRAQLLLKADNWSKNAAPADVVRLTRQVRDALQLQSHAPIPVTPRR